MPIPKLHTLCKTCGEQTVETVNAVSPEAAQRARRREFFGQLMEMVVDKNRRYDMHNPIFDALEKTFEEREERVVEPGEVREVKTPLST